MKKICIMFVLLNCYSSFSQKNIKPNLIFVYSDQHRRMGLSFYNDTRFDGTTNQGDPVQTPNLDKMAKEGAIFHNSVVASPICSPNRATLMTGNYPSTHQLIANSGYEKFGYDNVTIAHVLRDNGYETAHIGKWHIAKDGRNWSKFKATNGLAKRGFNYWYGTPVHNHQHFDVQLFHDENEIDGLGEFAENGKKLPNPFIPSAHYKDRKLQKQESWGPNHLTRKALDYLKNTFAVRDASKPFALYVSYNPPHTIHGPKPSKGSEPSHHIAGIDKSGATYFGQKSLGIENFDYKAPIEFEQLYREGKTYESEVCANLKKRPNVPNEHYSRTKCLPGYYGAINSIDVCFGKIEEYLSETPDPRYPNKVLKETSIVVYTADHGEMMGSHGRMTKGIYYEESIGVPLIIRYPNKIKESLEVNNAFNSVDLAPTLLGLLNISFPNKVDGKDRSQLLTNTSQYVDDKTHAFSSYKNWSIVRTSSGVLVLEEENLKVENKQRTFFYDLEKDPFQMRPIEIKSSCKLKKVLLKHLRDCKQPVK